MKDRDAEIIRLCKIEGTARLSGEDTEGGHWTQFEVDYLAQEEDGECNICGAVLSSGWLCLDGGDEICDEHVVYTTKRERKQFLTQYILTALWSSCAENGEPLDQSYSRENLSKEALAKMQEDCESFLIDNYELVEEDIERAAHDFWLTRNRHGAGFWDGDWEEAIGRKLTEAAHAYGSADLYIGDDRQIYHS